MVQKRAGYPDGDPRKKFKYRVVLRGNDIKEQSFEVALFQEMATTPTTLEASRFCDLLGLLEGTTTQGRYVEQAYLLANMKGPVTYIVLSQEVWTKAMWLMHRPVFSLERALYGHPLAGAFWHKHCTHICHRAGFRLFSDNWPCCYRHDETITMLIAYVDDMKISGPKDCLATHWANLWKGTNLVVPLVMMNVVLLFWGAIIIGPRRRSKVNFWIVSNGMLLPVSGVALQKISQQWKPSALGGRR